jgi:hypothetical protein
MVGPVLVVAACVVGAPVALVVPVPVPGDVDAWSVMPSVEWLVDVDGEVGVSAEVADGVPEQPPRLKATTMQAATRSTTTPPVDASKTCRAVGAVRNSGRPGT